MQKVLVLVVAYMAEEFIEAVFDRIAAQIQGNPQFEVLMIDDGSKDKTFDVAQQYRNSHPEIKLTNLFNPVNQGYGGNQQIGYQYAIENDFDVVIMLHGDGQYPPELIHEMVDPILNGQFDVMLGSRMLKKQDALAGGMPKYKWIGNQILTWIENRLLGQSLSEYHTGFRAYSVKALRLIPFQYNSKYYDFDTDILIQLSDNHFRIGERPIPTRYGDEICRVNGIKYAWMILRSCVQSRIVRLGLFYKPKFDYYQNRAQISLYSPKFGIPSSHKFAFDRIPNGAAVLDLGAGPGYMARELAVKNAAVCSVDRIITDELKQYSNCVIEADLDTVKLSELPDQTNVVLLLDVLEFLDEPEALLLKIRQKYAQQHPDVLISVGNVAFILTRLSLLFGKFNYGRLGILEVSKKRLFTLNSLKRLLRDQGYTILKVRGTPAPYHKALPKHKWIAWLLEKTNTLLIYLSKGLFSYQIFIQAKPSLTLEQLLENAKERT